MVALRSFLFATLTSIAAVSGGAINFSRSATTVATVEADIAKITVQVNSLDASLTAFGGSPLDALAINTDVANLVSAINTATTDTAATSPTDVSGDDANRIIGNVGGPLTSSILHALKTIVEKKPKFAAILIVVDATSLVLQGLKNLQTATLAFETALIAATPADLKNKAQAIADEVNASFATAIQAYS